MRYARAEFQIANQQLAEARAEALMLRERLDEYKREVERRDELISGADASLVEARAERDLHKAALLKVHDALHRECDGKADLPSEIRALRTALEKAQARKFYECPDCAFTFDALHTHADGSYSCPACAEEKLAAEAAMLRETLGLIKARAPHCGDNNAKDCQCSRCISSRALASPSRATEWLSEHDAKVRDEVVERLKPTGSSRASSNSSRRLAR